MRVCDVSSSLLSATEKEINNLRDKQTWNNVNECNQQYYELMIYNNCLTIELSELSVTNMLELVTD